jgi:nitrous oxide reductase accessory protein NosL
MAPGRRILAALLLALWAALAAAQGGGAVTIPRPGPRDLCPVCGMLVSKYPNWVAVALYRDGHAHFFDGAKDMFKYLHELSKYAPGRRQEDLAGLWVTEFYGLTRIDARKAFYVIGSDVLGPMGHEPVPFETRADAEEFLRDHKGRQILTFDQITPDVTARLDAGRF